MRVANVLEKIEIILPGKESRFVMEPGLHVMSDTDCVQLRNFAQGRIGSDVAIDNYYTKYKGEDLTDKTIFCFRTGGIGDLLFMTSVFKYLKETYENVKIIAAAGFLARPVLFNNPYIDDLVSMPFRLEDMQRADYHLHFQGIIEKSSLAEKINAYDLFFHAFGIDYKTLDAESKRPIILLNKNEENFAKNIINKYDAENSIKIGFQIRTSTSIRTYSIDKLADIMYKILEDERIKIFCFGSPNDKFWFDKIKVYLESDIDKRVFLSCDFSNSLRDSMSVCSKMDYIISPDSALVHFAGAFDIPQIGLYGPFPSRLRMLYYKNAIGLNAASACAPCFKHGHFPCDKGDPSPCFSILDQRIVLQALDFLMEKMGHERLLLKDNPRHTEAQKVINRVKKYMVGEGLDVGCGYYKHDESINITTLDHSPFMSPDKLVSFEGLEEKKSYDFVFDSFCFHESENRKSFIEKAIRITKVGGHIIYYIPHKHHCPYGDMNDVDFKALVKEINDVEIVLCEDNSVSSFEDFDGLDKEKDEYAFTVVLRKIA